MKKNKKSLKKLTLNKKVVSKLEGLQANGGAPASGFICPIETRWNCPINTLACPDTWICPIETRFICPTDSLVCPIETIGCPIDTVACPY
ncbi:MAG: hypothetical protein AB8B65_16930 [Kordia sp.]|uniref:hypothetical protein n=1 Tax=Kordia sp. TaxID=1965332 RepID=UPI00385DAD87